MDSATGRRIGSLLALSGTTDVVDAHVALLAGAADIIISSDPADLKPLLGARGVRAPPTITAFEF